MKNAEELLEEFEHHCNVIESTEFILAIPPKFLKSLYHVIAFTRAALRIANEDVRRIDAIEAHPLPTEVHGGADDGVKVKAWAISCHPKFTLREAIDTAYPPT